jgi:hypothetical protein
MSELSHTIDFTDRKVEYTGISRWWSPQPPSSAQFLAVVCNEGEPDLWWLEDLAAANMLRRYYNEQEPWVKSPIHLFKHHVTV